MGKLTPGWLATWSLEDEEEQSWFKVPVVQGLAVRVTGAYPPRGLFLGWAGTITDRERKSYRLQVRVSASGLHGLDRSLYVVLGTGSTPSVQVGWVQRGSLRRAQD